MIPFARLVQYGNTAVVPVVKKYRKIDCSYSCTLVLERDDNLYYFGDPSMGEIPSSTSVKTLFASNVSDCSIAIQSSLYLTKDGKFIYNGSSVAIGQTPVVQVSNVDITSKFTSITTLDNIKKFMVSYGCMYFLTNDGNLYGCGNNSNGQLGLGASVFANNFTLIRSSVDDFKSNNNYGLFVLTGGVILACGSASDIGVGLSSGSQRTLTPISRVASIPDTYGTTLDGILATCRTGAVLYSPANNKLYSCGYRGGAFNNGASSDDYRTFNFSEVIMTDTTGAKLVYKGKMWSGAGDPMFPPILMEKDDGTGLGYYFSADNSNGIFGIGMASYEVSFRRSGISQAADYVCYQRGALYYSRDDYFLAAGNSSYKSIPGYTGNQYYFITPIGFEV